MPMTTVTFTEPSYEDRVGDGLFLDGLVPLLRRASDRQIHYALLVGREQLAGFTIKQIEECWELSHDETEMALQWIADAGGMEGDIRNELKQRASVTVQHALVIGQDLIDAYRPAEIRERHGISARQYRMAVGWLSWAIRSTPLD